MSELETLMWRSERHPVLSSTITVLLVLNETPDWDRLYAAHEWSVRQVPRCRERVVEPTFPVGPPAWVPDRDFDLDYHLRRTRLPRPGTRAQLLRLVQAYALAPFDRGRALWEGMLIEGLAGGGAAYLLKLHHSLTDGIRLLSLVQSRTPDRQGPAEAMLDLVARPARRVPAPPPAPPSPLLGNRSGRHWRFGVLECPLTSLRAAGGAAGGSVDDAYLAVLLGGLRRYHEEFGVSVDELSLALPLTAGQLAVPMVADPAERIARLRGAVRALGPGSGRLCSGADLSASSVPGRSGPVYLAGALVERVFPFGPLSGVAVMAAMVSHMGTCCVGINYDGHAITDHELLMDCLTEGLDEVLALAPVVEER